jgi:hypothetical protein
MTTTLWMNPARFNSAFSGQMQNVFKKASDLASVSCKFRVIKTHHLLQALFTELVDAGETTFNSAKNCFSDFVHDPIQSDETTYYIGEHVITIEVHNLLINSFTARDVDSDMQHSLDGSLNYIHILKGCVWSHNFQILKLLSDGGLSPEHINASFRRRFGPDETTTMLDSKDVKFGINQTVRELLEHRDWIGIQAYVTLLNVNPDDFQTFLMQGRFTDEAYINKLITEKNWAQLLALRQLSNSSQVPLRFNRLSPETLRAMPR